MTNKLSEKEIEAIRKRAEKATEGPWDFLPYAEGYEFVIITQDLEELIAEEVFEREDAIFIAHAREDIPKLLAEIERLRELLNKAYQYGTSSEAYQKDGDIKEIREYIYGGDDE